MTDSESVEIAVPARSTGLSTFPGGLDLQAEARQSLETIADDDDEEEEDEEVENAEEEEEAVDQPMDQAEASATGASSARDDSQDRPCKVCDTGVKKNQTDGELEHVDAFCCCCHDLVHFTCMNLCQYCDNVI